MNPVLLVEIISALIALCCLTTLIGNWLWMKVRARGKSREDEAMSVRRNGWKKVHASEKPQRRIKSHRTLGIILIVSAVVHGTAASIYASGAPRAAYAAGWLALALIAAAGACALNPLRARLRNPARWHIGLFLAGTALFIAHAAAAHM